MQDASSNVSVSLVSLVELKKHPSWIHSRTFENKEKVPAINVDNVAQRLTYRAAKNRQSKTVGSKYVGLILSQAENIIVIDIDVDPSGQKKHATREVPEQVLSFLVEHPTHAHLSPSGHGVHIVYRLSETDANRLRNISYKKNPQVAESAPFLGDILWSNAFVIMTEDAVPQVPYTEDIAEVELDTLFELCPSTKMIVETKSGTTALQTTASNNVYAFPGGNAVTVDMPNVPEIKMTIPRIPPTVNRYVLRAYAGLNWPSVPSSYDHWLTICFAMSHAAVLAGPAAANDLYLAFDEWSQLDPDGYEGPADTMAKWTMCMQSTMDKMVINHNDPTIISYRLIFKLAALCYPQYPILDVKTRVVLPNSADNISQLLQFHDVHIIPDAFAVAEMFILYHKDTAPFIEPSTQSEYRNDTVEFKYNGKNYIAKSVNKDTLELALVRLAQRSGFPMAISKHGKLLGVTAYERMPSQDYSKYALNKFVMWVESKAWDGKNRIDALLDTLHYHDETTQEEYEHYRNVMRKVLLWMVGVHYYDSHGHTRGTFTEYPCMPILFGPEHTYKSSWIKHLMAGSPLGTQAVKEVSSELINNDTEFSRVTVVSSILLVDECELALKKVSEFKNKITRQHDSNRGMYRDGYKNYPRRCAIFGTSNAQSVYTSRDGNRRLFIIRIKQCDTDTQALIDKQQLYAELKVLYQTESAKGNITPWQLTKKEIDMNNKLAAGRSAKSNVDILLHELFGDAPFNINDFSGPRGGFLGYTPLKKSGRIMSAIQVTKLLHERYQFKLGTRFHINEVEHALRSFCKKYTGTSEADGFSLGKQAVYNGCTIIGGTDYYLVPPVRSEAEIDASSDHEDEEGQDA